MTEGRSPVAGDGGGGCIDSFEARLIKKLRENAMVRIVETQNNRFALTKGATVLKTYTRRRDAVRGAERLGLVLA